MRFFRILLCLRRAFFRKFSSIFWFFVAVALANLEERIQKFIDTAFFWPVEVGEILMRFLVVKTRFDHNSAKSARIENSFGD